MEDRDFIKRGQNKTCSWQEGLHMEFGMASQSRISGEQQIMLLMFVYVYARRNLGRTYTKVLLLPTIHIELGVPYWFSFCEIWQLCLENGVQLVPGTCASPTCLPAVCCII